MLLAFVTIKVYYFLAICGGCFAIGFLIQERKVRYYREKQVLAEKEKLKMQADMLGLGDLI